MCQHGNMCFIFKRFVIVDLQKSNCTKLFTYIVPHSVTVYNIPYAVNATWRQEKRNTLVSVLDRNTMDIACQLKSKRHLISQYLQWKDLLLMPKVVKLCTTLPALSVINTMLSLSKVLATLTFLSRVSYWDIFSAMVLLCCHVPGCHEGTLLATVSRSRCETHASNPKLLHPKSPDPQQLKSRLKHTVSYISKRVLTFRKERRKNKKTACQCIIFLPLFWVVQLYKSVFNFFFFFLMI